MELGVGDFGTHPITKPLRIPRTLELLNTGTNLQLLNLNILIHLHSLFDFFLNIFRQGDFLRFDVGFYDVFYSLEVFITPNYDFLKCQNFSFLHF